MSPPLLVTEDTPPDMLTGHMDLPMVLPNGNRVRMSVDRRTPMMDLLVQVTTAYKISPAGHVLQPYGECGVLPYKPSTPIGALDTWTVHIIPKNQALQNPASKISLKQVQQPFEQTFRFQVNLPKNQLYVTRVTGRTMMGDLLRQACSEKGLDHHKYSLRHPKHLDRNLNEDLSVVEYGHNQVSMVSNKTLPSSVSSEDILAMAAYSGKSSESSSRSLSPDSSVSPQAPVQPSRPIRKRRPAPKPPVQPSQPNQKAKPKEKDTQKDPPSNGPVICHSRTSSDSSGYHEASVLSESPDSNNSSLPDSLPRRSKLPSKSEPKPSNKLSRSLSNLHHESTAPSTSMKPAQSTSCLAPSRKKKPAPAPPVLAIEEEKEEAMPARSSRTLPPGVRLVEVEPRAQHRPSNPSNRLASPPIVATSVEPKGKPFPVDVSPTKLESLSPVKKPNVTTGIFASLHDTPIRSVIGSPSSTKTTQNHTSHMRMHPTNSSPNEPPQSPGCLSPNRPDSSDKKILTSSLLEELDSALKNAQVAPDTQQISVRDLLKKFTDSAKPVPNFTLTTYNPKEVRRITKYSETGVSYYNYDLNHVRSPESPSRRRTILKTNNSKPKPTLTQNNNSPKDNLDLNKNKIFDVYSDIPSENEPFYHSRNSNGSLTSNIKEMYKNSPDNSKPTNQDIQDELDNIARPSNVKQFVDADSNDSFDSELSDNENSKQLMQSAVNGHSHFETANHDTIKSFFDDIIMGVKVDENFNSKIVDMDSCAIDNLDKSENEKSSEENGFDDADIDNEKVIQDIVSTNSSFDATNDSVIDEINRAIDSVSVDEDSQDTDEFTEDDLNKEFRVSPVIGVQQIENVFDEYVTEFTNIPIVIVEDEDEPNVPDNVLNGPRPSSSYLNEPEIVPESPKRPRKAIEGPRFGRTDSTEIGGFEGPKEPNEVFAAEVIKPRGMDPAKKPPEICFAKEESLDVEIVRDLTEPRDDTISMSSTSSDGTTIREVAKKPGTESVAPPKPLRRRVFSGSHDTTVFDKLEYLMKRRSVQEGLKIKEEPTIVSQKSLSDIETERVEDEIERMFEEATREHVSLESGVDVCDSSPGLPSPEASGLPSPDLIHDTPHEPLPLLPDTPDQKNEDDPFNWEYKLPAPPTFRDVVDRDDTSSPLLTEYSTMTVGNMKEVLYQPSAAGDGPEPPKIIGVMERRAAQELAASERRAALDLAASERRAAQVLAASERRGAQELAAVERRTAAQATVERLAVAEELAAVVEAPNRGLAASKVPEPAAPLADPLLDNFRITTYLGIKESVKVFEEKTTPKRFETNLARRSSFTDNDQPRKVGGRPYLSGGVKRSVSHVSPLTRARMGLSVSNVDLASVSDSDRVGPSVSSRNLTTADLPEPVFCLPRTGLRKTISELSINIDPSDERDEYHENDERENGLQSISVLRSILPQLSRSQTALNSIGSSNHEMPSAVKEVQGGFRRPNISLSTWGERPKRQISIKSDKDYVIGGAKPAVNDARTINGAVKEPVLVNGAKPAARPVEKPATPEKPSAGVVKTPSFKGPKTMAYKMLETGNTKPLKQILEKEKFIEPVKSTPKFQEFDSGDGLESEHAPIVRAVELKKPYKMELENRMIKDPVPPPSLPEDSLPTPFYLKPTAEPVANPSTLFDQRRLKPGAEHAKSASNPPLFRMKSADDQTKPAVELAKPAQPFDQRRLKPAEAERLTANPSALFDQRRLKPAEARRPSERPVSSYLFGCEPTVPPPPNPPPPPKKYMSIVDLSRPLKPVASRSSKPRQREVDPREELMSSIRKFGKNSLRKVSAR